MLNTAKKSDCANIKLIIIGVTAVVVAGLAYSLIGGGNSNFYKDSKVVAKVDGKPVYEMEADNIVKAVLSGSEKPVSYKDLDEKSKTMIIREVAAQRAMIEEAKKQGISDDADMKRQLHEFKNKLIMERFVTKVIGPEITEEKLTEKYNEIEKNVKGKPQIKVSHILVKSENDAKDVIEKLKTDSFSKLAKDFSLDNANKDRGGDLGYLLAGTMDADFEKAALSLKAGEVSAPVKTKFGWHVIKLEERKLASVAPFEALKPRIFLDLNNELIKNRADSLLENIKIELVASESDNKPADVSKEVGDQEVEKQAVKEEKKPEIQKEVKKEEPKKDKKTAK